MSHMTKLPGVPDTSDIIPGMAYFPNTGPIGATCGGCKFRGYWRSSKSKYDPKTDRLAEKRFKSQGCKKFLELAMKFGPPVDRKNPACKYFESRYGQS